jgi:hypothetical protein
MTAILLQLVCHAGTDQSGRLSGPSGYAVHRLVNMAVFVNIRAHVER